jgi:RNA recognition motif-containing protein
LYVKNLSENLIKDDDLKKYFEQFGKVKNAKVYLIDTLEKDPIGNPIMKGKGYGFVCFES